MFASKIDTPLQRYIDIHTHKLSCETSWCLRNIDQRTMRDFSVLPFPCSIGLHPWFLEKSTLTAQLSFLEKQAISTSVKAIGECGLDYHISVDRSLQTEAFVAQIDLAKRIQKPLIIHCVKAFNPVIQLLEQQQIDVPVIFHGFNRKNTIAQTLIKAGYYLSFGAALLNKATLDSFLTCPITQLFLETDDAAVTIQEIYQKAATLRQLTPLALCQQLENNLNRINIRN